MSKGKIWIFEQAEYWGGAIHAISLFAFAVIPWLLNNLFSLVLPVKEVEIKWKD